MTDFPPEKILSEIWYFYNMVQNICSLVSWSGPPLFTAQNSSAWSQNHIIAEQWQRNVNARLKCFTKRESLEFRSWFWLLLDFVLFKMMKSFVEWVCAVSTWLWDLYSDNKNFRLSLSLPPLEMEAFFVSIFFLCQVAESSKLNASLAKRHWLQQIWINTHSLISFDCAIRF